VKAVRDALPDLTAAGVAVMGISPDKVTQQKKFHDKHDLGFPLISDENKEIAEAYGVWAEKKMYGKTFMGIVRSAFLIDEKGNIAATGYKISPKNTVPTLMKWLEEA
jgi:peroxiredoxin Q/BCP